MSVPQTNFILRMDETTGTTMTNVGSTSGNYTMGSTGSPTNPTDYTWHTATGSWLGQFEGKAAPIGTTKMAWFSTAATAPANTKTTINCWCSFNISDIPGGLNMTRFIAVRTGSDDVSGDVAFEASAKSGSNFTLIIRFTSSTGREMKYSYTGLTLGTAYHVAASLNVTSLNPVVGLASLNGATAVSLTPRLAGHDDWTGGSDLLSASWPYVLRRNDSNGALYCGIIGVMQGLAYQRGGTAWTGAELATISANPATITGWSTAAAIPVPIFQNNYQLR